MSKLQVETISHTNNTTAMTIDSSGNTTLSGKLTQSNLVVFEAYLTRSNPTVNSGSNAGLTYNNVEQQGGTNFSTSTGKFTVPITGFYQFNIRNNIYGVDSGNFFRQGLLANGTGFSTDEALLFAWITVSSTGDYTISSSHCRKYTTGDTLQPFIRVGEGGLGSAGRDYQNFSGFLVTPT